MNVPVNQAINPDARPATVDIDALDVSAEWKRYFREPLKTPSALLIE